MRTAALASIMALLGCLPGSSADEVLRLPSLDAALDAVVVERNGGATVPFVYEVFVLPHGAPTAAADPAARLIGAARSADAWGVNLRWSSAHTLQVSYLQAESARVDDQPIQVGEHRIRLELRAGENDPTAPAGSMVRAASAGAQVPGPQASAAPRAASASAARE